jgi:hypothetical protein
VARNGTTCSAEPSAMRPRQSVTQKPAFSQTEQPLVCVEMEVRNIKSVIQLKRLLQVTKDEKAMVIE